MIPSAVYQDALDSYTLSDFQDCLKQLHSITYPPSELKSKIDLLTYRAYIAQKKFNVVINEIEDTHDDASFRLVLLLAKFLSGVLTKDEVINKLASELAGDIPACESTCLIIAATIYMYLEMPTNALSALHEASDLYSDAMTVHCLLIINRSDIASKVVRRMQIADEDALPCQLASAEFCLTQGADKLNEALNIYQELQEKYRPTLLLLNGQAAALMAMGRWTEADAYLQQALDMEPSNPETLMNILAVSQHTGKPAETVNRYLSQLRDCDKKNTFLATLDHMDNIFDEAAKLYTATV